MLIWAIIFFAIVIFAGFQVFVGRPQPSPLLHIIFGVALVGFLTTLLLVISRRAHKDVDRYRQYEEEEEEEEELFR